MKIPPLFSLVSSLFTLALLAGCLSSAPKDPVCWLVEADTGLTVSAVRIRAPYDSARIPVLRADGSIAFDAYNVFAAKPSRFVADAVKTVRNGEALTVRTFALDCRGEGKRDALVELELEGGVKSVGTAPTDDGNYSKAFSAAFMKAAEGLKTGK